MKKHSETAPQYQLFRVDSSHYERGHELARGGQGRIWAAIDRRLRRRVAIKELIGKDPQLRQRFEREVLITARLQHPAIVPVHEAGEWEDGDPFYTMKLVSGQSLAQLVEESRTLASRIALLPNVITVVDALAFAHSQGVIHRDLKPTNIIVGSFGETVVIDWGLAKWISHQHAEPLSADEDRTVFAEPGQGATVAIDEPEVLLDSKHGSPDQDGAVLPSSNDLTMLGSIVGTPAYMSPEQARGQDVDTRSDVFSLGAILYNVLSGKPPYRGKTSIEVLQKARQGELRPLESVVRGVPPDLSAIVRKAMAAAPEERYPSANELAVELRRFQTGQLVSAHAYTSTQLLRRWGKRYRSVLGVSLAAAALLIALGIIGVRRIVSERDQAERAQARAAARADEITIVQARSWLDQDPTVAFAWLKGLSPDSPRWSAARLIIGEGLSRGVYRVFPAHLGRAWQARYAPDGKSFATCGDDSTLRLWGVSSKPRVFAGHKGLIKSIDFSSDGRYIVSASFDQSVRLWERDTGEMQVLKGHRDVVSFAEASPSGRYVASASWDQTLRIWDVETGQSRILSGHEGRVHHLAFSPDGERLASGSADQTVRVWNVASGGATVLVGHEGEVERVRWSPDATTLASASQDHTVRLWDTAGIGADAAGPNRSATRVLSGHTNFVTDLAFSTDGRLLATSSLDQTVRIWDLETLGSQKLSGHAGEVLDVDFSPTGQWVASGSVDQTVRLWNLEGEGYKLTEQDGWVLHVEFSKDGSHLLSSSADGTVREWVVPSGDRRILRGHTRAVLDIALSPDGRSLASCSLDNTVRLWDLQSGEARALEGHSGGVRRVAFSPSGHRIASAGGDKTVRLWDVASGEGTLLSGHEAGVEYVAFSPDGASIATASLDNTVRLWNVRTGESRVLRGHESKVSHVSFSPDGSLLSSVGSDDFIRVWRLRDGGSTMLQGHEGFVLHAEFGEDGRTLASAGSDGTIRLWNLDTGEATVLAGHTGWVRHVAFAPNDNVLASASADGSVRLWDLDSQRDRVLTGLAGDVKRVAFSPTGDRVAAASTDGVVRMWDVSSGEVRSFTGHSGGVELVLFDDAGETIVSTGLDGTIRLWRDALPDDPDQMRQLLQSASNAEIGANNEVEFR